MARARGGRPSGGGFACAGARRPGWAGRGPAVFERSAGLRRRTGGCEWASRLSPRSEGWETGVGGGRCVRSAIGDDRKRSEIVAAAFRAACASRPGSSRLRGEAAAGEAVLLCLGRARSLGCCPRPPVGSARRGDRPSPSLASPGHPPAPRAADAQVRHLGIGTCPGRRVAGRAAGSTGCTKAIEHQLRTLPGLLFPARPRCKGLGKFTCPLALSPHPFQTGSW